MNKKPSNPQPPKLPDQWNDWEGTFDELIVESGKVLAQVSPETTSPSGSLVRYYQQKGVVGRGTTSGRTKRFGAQELSQVVGAKWLVGNSIPLDLAKSAITGAAGGEAHPAQALVAQLMQSAGLADTVKAATPKTAAPMPSPRHSAFMAQSVEGGAMAMSNAMFSSTSSIGAPPIDYVSLPAGGTVRYALEAGTTVELATDGDIQAQAQALQTLATQLLATLSKTSPTS